MSRNRLQVGLGLLALGFGAALLPLSALAQDTEEMGFDEVEEPAPAAHASWTENIHISGRFDLNLEKFSPGGDPGGTEQFRNYHHFLFVKASPYKDISFSAEVLDQSYYEIQYTLSPRASLKAGKIWVPFGLTPFHHFYGGVQGDPFTGKLVPNVWAELGFSIDYRILQGEGGSWNLHGDTYAIRGFDGAPGTILDLSSGGSDDVFAYGQRLTLSMLSSKVVVAGSGLWNEWGPEDKEAVVLWGGDLTVGYGLIDVAFLRDLSFRGAFARAEIRDPAINDLRFDEDSDWYWKYGDFAELSYGHWRPGVTLKARFGTYVDFGDIITQEDMHSFNLAAVRQVGPLSLVAHYFWVFEEANEIDNDFVRLSTILAF